MKDLKLKGIFSNMLIKCPLEISSYGKCLLICKEKDIISKGICQKEFLQLMKCFEHVILI